MKSSQIFSITLAVLSTLACSIPNVAARSTAKYTNIPFIVAASCPNDDPAVSSRIVTSRGVSQVQIVADTLGYSGFDMYCSNPGSGTLPSTATGTFPEGILSFKITGLPAGATVNAGAVYTDNPTTLEYASVNVFGTAVYVSANSPATTPGSPLLNVQVYIETASGTATILMSGFQYNNTAVAFDTTISDVNNSNSPNFCYLP